MQQLLVACLLILSGCSGAAAPAEPTPANERATANARADEPAEPVWVRIAREEGVPRLTLDVDPDEVARQEALGGQVDFEAAFRGALRSFLTDGGDLESPISLFRNGEGLSEEAARARTREVLDQPTSRLGLVPLERPAEDDPSARPWPQGDEDPRRVWVFYLLTQETYDNGHWAVAPRDGGPVYNYGFN